MTAASADLDTLPDGVALRPLPPNRDERGAFTEIFRESWQTGIVPVQWNMVRSHASVLRGVHLHLHHDEVYVLPEGDALIGLKDLRRRTATRGVTGFVRLAASRPQLLTVPRGLAHGLYFITSSLLLSGVTAFYNPEDEIGCRWDDPDLGIAWPVANPSLSERDSTAPTLAFLQAAVDRAGL